MLRAEVNRDICQVCDPCSARLACTTKAVVKIDADEPAFIELARRNGCGDCLPACPYGATALSNANVSNARGARMGSA
jgi:Fe-S-cluster-containing hydrogenase component 2